MPAFGRLWTLPFLALVSLLHLFPAATASTTEEPPWFPAEGAYFGAWVSDQADPEPPACRDTQSQAGRQAFEGPACVTRQVFVDHRFHLWDSDHRGRQWPNDYDRWSRDQGRRLFFNWTATRRGGAVVPWGSIADGHHDATIDAQAERIRAFAAPVYISFHAEPDFDGMTSPWGTRSDFRAAWRRIVDRFRARNVTNVRWVLTLVEWTFEPKSRRDPWAYWPGDAYVDAVGVDGYNSYGCRGEPKNWKSFGRIFDRPYEWILRTGKPMIIAEFGSVEDPQDPVRKFSWHVQAAEWIRAHPNVKGVFTFHSWVRQPAVGKNCNYIIDSSLASLVSFRRLAADPWLNP